MHRPKLTIFASGGKTGGGSGFANLVDHQKRGLLEAEIIAVVSNHENGGVREIAKMEGIPFVYFPGPFEPAEYKKIVNESGAEYVALSGWLKLVSGLPANKTFNIHPGPLPDFGGAGMYGHFVHEAVMKAFAEGKVTHSAVTMHFVTDPKGDKSNYDKGPVVFQFPVKIKSDDTLETLAKRLNVVEHAWQPFVTNLVTSGLIFWTGKTDSPVQFPDWYLYR